MKRLHILPVYPLFPVSFWSFKYALDFIDVPAQMPPLGLATVAAMLPQDHFDIHRIIDLNVEPLQDEQIKAADLIFASSMLVQRDSLEEIISRAHTHGKKVVAGGPYPTSYREEVKADHLVLGEAEASLQPFLNDLLQGNAKKVYDESSLKGKPSLHHTPVPRWDLLNVKKYSSFAIQYSRGCPFDCEFCDITNLFGRVSRTKTTVQMIKELEAVKNTGWRGSLFVVDDNFIGNKTKVRQLLPAVKSWQEQNNHPFSLFTEASTDLGLPNHADILEGMVAAGFDQVFLGIESPDAEVLEKMNKKHNSRLYEKIRNIQRAGLEVLGGFIVGNDKEKPEVFQNLFQFIQETGVVIPMVGLLTALRNTRLYERLSLEGRLRGESSGNNTHHLGFNFKPELDEAFLMKGYVSLLDKLFSSKNFYERCRILGEHRGHYHTATSINKSNIKAFAKILYQNLIRSPDYHFIAYALGTALTRPRQFPDAMNQAAKLYHFKTMTKATVSVQRYQEVAESIYQRFQKKVSRLQERFTGDIESHLQNLQHLSYDMLEKASKKYHRIHEDFRADAKGILDDLRQRMESYIHSHKLALASTIS